MSKKYIFAILGGDSRQAVVAQKLLSCGHTVRTFGLDSASSVGGADIFSSFEKTIYGCDVVILPLPVSRDRLSLSYISVEKFGKLSLEDIVKAVSKNKNCVIIGGLIPESMKDMAKKHGVKLEDYYEKESLQQKNALPSAEGAIMIAMENTDKTIEGMNVLIGGYGRIGKILASKMKALGADVTVAARRDEVLCEIAMSGYKTVYSANSDEMSKEYKNCDVIINTVPSVIFSKSIINGEHRPVYIEVASAPGGIDVICARNIGLPIVFAQSIPGKYAPINAGEYIFETICDILKERGMDI